jgi:cell division GTPase FtsZ
MTELNLPSLDIEDFDPEIAEAAKKDAVEDESGGALTYAIIGSGQGGGRIAKAFYDLGYKKTVVFNTAKSDLTLLELPEDHKFYVDYYGDQGAGKNQEKAKVAYESRSQEIFNKLREVFGENIDRILICVGVAGGTGGGSVNTLVDIAKRYFTYVGRDDASDRVGVVASLPTTGECASPAVAKNAYNRMTVLSVGAENGDFAPLVIVDNDKIKKLYPQLTVKQFWPTLNNTVAGLFHVFNVLATKNSNYTAFDPADYDTIMKTKGCMIFGVTSVKNVESETSVSNALKQNLEKTLLAGGFNLTTAEGAASIIVGGTKLYEEVAGLMDSIEYGFDTLATITGGAIIHRGIYEDSARDKLVAYTMVGGLDAPEKRLEDLKKFLTV